MAINKELKEYINKRYDAKIKALRDTISKKESEIARNREAIREEFLQTTQVKKAIETVVKGIENLEAVLSENNLKLNWEISRFVDRFESFISLQTTREIAYNDETINKIRKEIDEVNEERDAVIIKLSLTKDFDTINEILREYGIGLQ